MEDVFPQLRLIIKCEVMVCDKCPDEEASYRNPVYVHIYSHKESYFPLL